MLDGVTSLDERVGVWIATHRIASINDVFVWLGWIDRLGAVWVVVVLLMALAMWRRALPAVGLAIVTALATVAADGIAMGVKDLAHRTRPFIAHPQIHPLYVVHSSSFPSGHAATAFAGAVVASYLVPRATPLFVAFACLIGYSRMYVGVHYPGDVLVGAAIGACVGLAAVLLLRLRDLAPPHLVARHG